MLGSLHLPTTLCSCVVTSILRILVSGQRGGRCNNIHADTITSAILVSEPIIAVDCRNPKLLIY